MPDLKYFCPDCGAIELDINRSPIITGPGDEGGAGTASCTNCAWEGPISSMIGAATTQQFWDAERVGDVLLRVLAKTAAGPMIQCLEFIGILPKYKTEPDEDVPASKLEAHNRLVEVTQTHVLRSVLSGAIAEGFVAAEQAHRLYSEAMGTELHQVFREPEGDQVTEEGGTLLSPRKYA